MLVPIGPMYYGREFSGKGYITTEWFCLMYVPIIPVASYMVMDETGNSWKAIAGPADGYEKIKLDHIHGPHLVKGYSATLIVLIILALTPYVIDLFRG